jgi:outer membrane protein assembly factor BamB
VRRVTLLALVWPMFAGGLARTGFTPDAMLTPAAAPAPAWNARLGGVLDAQPAVAGDTVVAASENGVVAALDLDTGRTLWRRRLPARRTTCADLPHGEYGISTTPVVSGSRVYVVAEDGRAYALGLRDGRTARGWPVRALADPRAEHVWGALALWRGRLYVPAASRCDNAFYHGEVVAISVSKHRRIARWSAVPRGHGGGVWAWGGIAVDAARGRLYVATANAQGRGGEAFAYGEHVVALDARLRVRAANHPAVPRHGDADFGGHPMLIDASGCPPLLAVAHKAGAVLLYDRRRLGRGPLQRLQAGDPALLDELGTYAWSPPRRTLYLANASDGPIGHGMAALRLGADCRLHARWRTAVEDSPYRPGPVTVTGGGVVAWSGGTDGRVFLADAASGGPAATLRVGAPVYGGVTIVGATVLVPAWDGRLHAYR